MRITNVSKSGGTTITNVTEINGIIPNVIGLIVSIFIILIGIIFTLITILSYYTEYKQKNYIETSATIVEIYDGVIPDFKVKYSVAGREYTSVDAFETDDVYTGAIITIRYNPDDPSMITTSTKNASIVFLIITVLILMCGILTFIRNIKKIKIFKNMTGVEKWINVQFNEPVETHTPSFDDEEKDENTTSIGF